MVQRSDSRAARSRTVPVPLTTPAELFERRTAVCGRRVGVALMVLVAIAAALAGVIPGSSKTRPTSPTSFVGAILDEARLPPTASAVGRSAASVPSDGVVIIYAYNNVSILKGSTGMVTVSLDAAKSRALLAVLNRLPLGPSGRCMENELVYRLSVRVPGQRTLTAVAGWACNAAVLLTVGGSPRPTLKDVSCALLHAVISDLPPNEANGTRHASIGCRDEAATGPS